VSNSGRILYVHHRPELGGAPQSLSYLLEHLDRTRFEAHVYCPGGPAAEIFERAGAQVHIGPVSSFTHIWASTYSGRRWLLLMRELWWLLGHVRAFRAVLRKGGFAIVHLNDSPLIPAAALAQLAGVPVVWHLRSALATDGPIRSRSIRQAIRRYASATIAINDDVARSFGLDAAIIPNAVDLERFRPGPKEEARRDLELPEEPVIVAYFGFIYPSKGFRDFIEAARLVRRSGVEALYLIVGGPVRDARFFRTPLGRTLAFAGLVSDHQVEAERLVARLGLEDCVRFVPFMTDTARMFQATDIVVAPSRGPELGRPVLEACASGRPVIASGSLTGGGILLPDETGILIPRRSPDSLATVLESLIGSPQERHRLGANARAYAEQHFAAARNAEQVMDIYDHVIGSTA
jgi:glycosyltransferase involved in cell wall biosynthesis